jgi:hypothetical protein
VIGFVSQKTTVVRSRWQGTSSDERVARNGFVSSRSAALAADRGFVSQDLRSPIGTTIGFVRRKLTIALPSPSARQCRSYCLLPTTGRNIPLSSIIDDVQQIVSSFPDSRKAGIRMIDLIPQLRDIGAIGPRPNIGDKPGTKPGRT